MDRILFLVLEYIRKVAQVFTICKATERGGGGNSPRVLNLKGPQWVVPKKIHSPPTEEISAVRGGGEGNHLKNVLNLYRRSGEGEGGIVNFLHGGRWIFSGMTQFEN